MTADESLKPISAVRERAKSLLGFGRTLGEGLNDALEGRGNVVMVRVNDETLRALDSLVDSGMFKARSEAAAYLLHEGIRSKADILEQIQATVSQIEALREKLKTNLQADLGVEELSDDAPAAKADAPASSSTSDQSAPPDPAAY